AHVTMINPRQIKGGQIALDLATSCPDIPFVFLEAWTNTDPFVASVRQQASQLRNVTWKSADTPALQVYRSTRLLLMPSLWEETWGRVATEVHLSGIPVLSTSMAALPESVGPGGVL